MLVPISHRTSLVAEAMRHAVSIAMRKRPPRLPFGALRWDERKIWLERAQDWLQRWDEREREAEESERRHVG